jgi:hypothetical protein
MLSKMLVLRDKSRESKLFLKCPLLCTEADPYFKLKNATPEWLHSTAISLRPYMRPKSINGLHHHPVTDIPSPCINKQRHLRLTTINIPNPHQHRHIGWIPIVRYPIPSSADELRMRQIKPVKQASCGGFHLKVVRGWFAEPAFGAPS